MIAEEMRAVVSIEIQTTVMVRNVFTKKFKILTRQKYY